MKIKIFTLSFFLIATLMGGSEKVYAQKETFDLVTYAVPKGWKKEVKPNTSTSYTITNKQKKTYCQINIMLSVNSKGGIKEDFESEWQGLIVEGYKATDTPKITEPASDSGWTVQAGMTQFKFNNENAIAMLTTMSGFGKTVSIVTVTNSQDYLESIQSFLQSVEMKVPDTSSKTATENNLSGSSIIGTWGIAKSGSQRYDDYNNAYASSNYGYINSQYTFNENGTYSFYTKTFKMVFDKILLTRENGTYKISGDQITIIPVKSVIEAWSKKDGIDAWGKLLSTQNKKLEKVTYQFTKHYFSGIQVWNLVLQAATPTERDGPYSGNLTFKNAWLYAPISTGNPAIQLPAGQQVNAAAETKGTVQPPAGTGFAFTTSNFDDGWVATVQPDWVQVTKGTTQVNIHYPNKDADDYNPDLMAGLKHAWDVLIAPRYNASNVEFKPISDWQSVEFAEADANEKSTGKSVHIVLFKKNYYGGKGKYLEFITPDKRSFEQEFVVYQKSTSGWDKLEVMANYNKFAVAASDLRGKWSNKFTGTTQYVNAITGLDAGMTSHASVENYVLGPGNDYKWDLTVASGVVGNLKFQNVKSNGKFSMLGNWQVKFSDIEGKPRTFNAYFSCVKGLRILWLDDTAFAKIE